MNDVILNVCGAKTRAGGACQRPGMPNGRCDKHGGKSLAGIASPQMTTGKYSKYLPQRMLERYHEAAEDSELIALRDDVALIDSRIADMLQRVDTGESGEIWSALLKTVHAFKEAEFKANSSSDPATQVKWKLEREQCMETITGLCQEGMADYAAWSEVKSLVEQRRKLVETEQKRLVAMNQMITNEQAMVIQARILDIIRRNVTDRTTLANISSEFSRLSLAGAGARA